MYGQRKGKAIIGVAIAVIMLATLMAMAPTVSAYDVTKDYLTLREPGNMFPVNPAFVAIDIDTTSLSLFEHMGYPTDSVKIGQELIFSNIEKGDAVLIEGIVDTNTDGEAFLASAFVTETVNDVNGVEGNDKTVSGIYFDTTSMGRTGTYIVSCPAKGLKQALWVSRPVIPLELKVGPDVVSTIWAGTRLRVDCSGASDLSLTELDLSSGTKTVEVLKGEVEIEVDKTKVGELQSVTDFDTGDTDKKDVNITEKEVTFDMPSTVVIGEDLELTVVISATSVAQEDSFTVEGKARGSDFVDIVTIAPNGGSGSGINPDSVPDVPGITHDSPAVSDIDYSFLKKLHVDEDAVTGKYLIVVVSPGRNGVYDGINSQDLFGSEFVAKYGPISDLALKTQEQILDIIEDATIAAAGSDDLLWVGYIKVETPMVRLNPIADVTVGEPLVVTGTSNRQDGYTIIVTCSKGPVELCPQTVQVENGTFEATFDTTDAVTGEYTVKADDGHGHTDEKDVNILPAITPPEVTLKKSCSPSIVPPGGNVTYTINYTNRGEADIHNVVITEYYPKGVTFISASPAPDQGTNIWVIGTLAANTSGIINITVKVPESRAYSFFEGGSVIGEGFVMVSKDIATEQKSYTLTNVVTLSCTELGPISATASTTLSGVPGTSISVTEHGSGIYESDESLKLCTKNRSISIVKSTNAVYRPTTFNFSKSFSVNFMPMWKQDIEIKNCVLGAAIRKLITDATYIEDEMRSKADNTSTTMEFDSSFNGSLHIGARTNETAISETYIGGFNVLQDIQIGEGPIPSPSPTPTPDWLP